MSKFKRVSLSSLTVGVTLNSPITDPFDQRVKLLAEGMEVTQAFIDRLVARGIDSVVMSQRDLGILNAFKPQGRRTKAPAPHLYMKSTINNEFSKELDRRIARKDAMSPKSSGKPYLDGLDQPTDCPYESERSKQWAMENDLHVEALGEFMTQAVCSKGNLGPLRIACDRMLDRMSEDIDAQVCLACAPYESEYPPRHGVHLAAIAMAIGVEMGLDRTQLTEIGIGCMAHDIGMKAIGLSTFNTKSKLTAQQLRVLADHPVMSIDLVGHYTDEITHGSQMVVYQIHERCDGSGYPRGRSAEEIHEYAKIAAVADAFTAMVSRRAHRLAIQGYYAIKQLLSEMTERKYDSKAIRALLQATSLYPLGSMVELNNDCVGRVIRSGGESFVRPTIEMWRRDKVGGPAAIVNLKQEPKIEITGTIPAIEAA